MRSKGRPVVTLKAAGSPNLGIISLRKNFITSVAFSVLVGHASIYPVKVSVSTSKYLNPFHMGIWVKSICQTSPGYESLRWTGSNNDGILGPGLL